MKLNRFSSSAIFFDSESWNPSKVGIENISQSQKKPAISPMFNVVLIDDNDHTYEYVIEMLMGIFGHSQEKAFHMALTVDYTGRVVIFTGEKEVVESKRNEIITYGPDWRLTRSMGSMSAVVEPVE
jgi:ATP-dependent Clp protease adaptor protein ClpS